MKYNDEVEILLAVYNGEKFIEEQLDSIAAQTYRNIFITVRDDGSDDSTPDIIRRYSEKHPGLIRNIEFNNTAVHGAKSNFARLLEMSTAEYVMFCDQDDVWLKDKVEKTLSAMKNEEGRSPGVGIAVHTDLYVTDEDLNIISSSFFEMDRIIPANNDLAALLISNTLTGCTVMINRILADIAGQIPSEAVMHDSWIAMCASAFGKIVTLYEPTIRYRQHGTNEIGVAARPGLFVRLYRYLFDKKKNQVFGKNASELYRAADSFAEVYSGRLTAEQYALCRTFGGMKGKPSFVRLFTILKHGYGGRTLIRRLKCWLLLNKEKYYKS